MRYTILSILFLFVTNPFASAQSNNWQELAQMPEAITNNAVSHGYIGNDAYIYSFAGLDSTKIWSGIHNRGFRYSVKTNTWDTIPSLPSGEGRIAASASTVKNKIYIIGGYNVFEDDSEISYNNVHIFDPETNSYLNDGASIPIPIDDHVQAVYRDSLIYVVTGWSNVNNVAAVQIYDTTKDIWLEGTSVPNSSSNEYKVFGASGGIVGDTIYYTGGARFGSNFPMTSALRKGYINPNDPTDITWITEFDVLAKGYRKGVALLYDFSDANNNENNEADIFWIGGSKTSYNYDGIAYNGSGGVEPDTQAISICGDILCNDDALVAWHSDLPVMDIRNVVTVHRSGVDFYVVGGMLEGQKVSNKIFTSGYAFTLRTNGIDIPPIKTFPNPANDFIQFEGASNILIRILNIQGQLVREQKNINNQIDVRTLNDGTYFLEFWNEKNKVGVSKIIIER